MRPVPDYIGEAIAVILLHISLWHEPVFAETERTTRRVDALDYMPALG
jgi:hypothetical protein